MKASTIAVAAGVGLGLAALAKRSSANAPQRTAVPEGWTGPAPSADVPTLSMLRAPEPPPAEQGTWSRLSVSNNSAQRSRVCQEQTRWWKDANCFGVPLAMIFSQQLDTSIGGWISVRLWADTDFRPVTEDSRPAASYWAWLGELKPGRKLTAIVNNKPIVGSELPAMTWIQSTARIGADGKLNISWRYPGDEHTGDERGRRYDAMLQWRITPNKPV